MALAKSGAPFATASPRSERVPEKRTINLVYTVEEGKRLYVERIEIHGNSKTRDDVIRREFEFVEGNAKSRIGRPWQAPARTARLFQDRQDRHSTWLGPRPHRGRRDTRRAENRRVLRLRRLFHRRRGIGETRSPSATQIFSGYRGHAPGHRQHSGKCRGFNISVPPIPCICAWPAGFPLGVDVFGKVFWPISYRSMTAPFMAPKSWRRHVDKRPARHETGLRNVQSGHLARSRAVGHRVTAREQAAAAGRCGLLRGLGHDFLLHARQDPKNPTRAAFGYSGTTKLPGLGGAAKFGAHGLRTPATITRFWRCRWHRAGAKGYATPWGGRQLPLLNGFFGGPQLVRGFAPNGFGPRDVTPGTTQDNVGGDVFSDDLRRVQAPVPFVPADAQLKVALFSDAGVVGEQHLERFEAYVAVAVATDRQLKRDPRLRRRRPDVGVAVRRAPGRLRLPHRQTILRRHPAAKLHRRRVWKLFRHCRA